MTLVVEGGKATHLAASRVPRTYRSGLHFDPFPRQAMSFRKLVKAVRVRRLPCLAPATKTEREPQKLAILVQSLRFAEKAAEASGVPYLKGAVALALEVAECVQGCRSNDEELNRLALSCATLMMDIMDIVKGGGDLSEGMQKLVEDLFRTLEKIENTAKEIVNSGGWAQRWFAHKDNYDRLNMLSRDVAQAQMRFMTLALIVKSQTEVKAQDSVYGLNSVVLGDYYASGQDWIAFNGKLHDDEENLIVKRYIHADVATRKAMHEADIKAFKANWHGNLLQYLGRSHPGAEQPYNLLRGVTSDHVPDYIASKFADNNQRGSFEALKLLKDLTNALAYTVGNTNSSSFDISKIHLNDSGNVVIVNLEPSLKVNGQSKDDMPAWRSWQEICIELLAGDPTYEPNPAIEYKIDEASHKRLEYLRPILGHIHYGGVRFKETSIENAFKSEGLVLAQALRDLRTIIYNPLEAPDAQVLRAMWRRSRELHYIAHFREPLYVDVGDIGYITGDPPQFIRLANVRPKITDVRWGGWNHGRPKVKPFRFLPRDKWKTSRDPVTGIIRHSFRFPNSNAIDLADWRNGRPRLDKDFLLRRINVPNEPGLIVECSEAWKVLAQSAAALASDHADRSVTASNLILVVYFKQQSGYATFRLNKKADKDQWRDIWAREGFSSPPVFIYFYESPPGGPNGVWGYFSFSPVPGSPHASWTPECDDTGEAWGWTFQSEDWTIEISKPNIKQYIRYVQL
ncbi:hypothetical protein DFH09DRAFT_1148317 [Mycena vulgaris]|nr:hypothetical protein DFH09DRAFT_1148317 [Mycena vulgaris]